MAGNDAQNGAFLAAIRVPNGGPPDSDGMSMISPNFEENPGQPTGLQNGPFFQLIAAKDCSDIWRN